MQAVTDNLPLILFVAVVTLFAIGLVLALRTEDGRNKLARASVRLAVFVLAMVEKLLSREIIGEKLSHIDARQVPPQHPIIQAQVDLQSWLGR